MSIEMVEVAGAKCVVVPEGTRPYTERDLIRNRAFLADTLITYKMKGPDALNEVAQRHDKDLTVVEKSLVRLIHTIGTYPSGPIQVFTDLGIELRQNGPVFVG